MLTATVNNIPLLVFPADTFASRQPDPVLQQLEQSNSLSTTTNDAFKPVCKYWDRVTRPEHIMTALINAMRVLTDPAETGACCILVFARMLKVNLLISLNISLRNEFTGSQDQWQWKKRLKTLQM